MHYIRKRAKRTMGNLLITGGSGFIGTNLIDYFLSNSISFINIDIAPPKKASHKAFWKECNILDKEKLQQIFFDYDPEIVIHLAAETRVGGKGLEYYKANTLGMENLLDVIATCKSIKRTIITSTQYVYQTEKAPQKDEQYLPLGVYGESKVITEKLTRNKNLDSIWTIIRPTNIWGPWHNVYPEGLWRQILKGRYLHPGGKPVYRSYGYIGNVIMQIVQIMNGKPEDINRKVFYVGDEPINLYDWVNAFSLMLIHKKVRVVPRVVLAAFAIVGDLLENFGVRFPLTTSRYHNMIYDNPAPMAKTFSVLGPSKYSLHEGVEATVNWYLQEYLAKK